MELFPEALYHNEKYLIQANAEEVSVYNLYSNILIAKHVRGFSDTNNPVEQKDGYFIFAIKKEVFDEPIDPADISKVDRLKR